jgi:hypothetical protein
MFRLTVTRLKAEVKFHERRKSSQPGDRVFDQIRADRVNLLQLAALLHTESATRVATFDPQTLGEEGWLAYEAITELFALKSDFEEYGSLRRPRDAMSSSNEEAPISYAPREVSWPKVRSFVHLWYLVMASCLQDVTELELLGKVLATGLDRFSNDPELLLARGCLYEKQMAVQLVDRSLAADIYMPDVLTSWRYTLSLAQADFANRSGGHQLSPKQRCDGDALDSSQATRRRRRRRSRGLQTVRHRHRCDISRSCSTAHARRPRSNRTRRSAPTNKPSV